MNNEDCFNVVEIPDKRTLFVVCDGMGGHSCGEVASQTVWDSFSTYWEAHPEQEDSKAKVFDAAKEASRILDEKSGYYQMGTTLVMCSIEGKRATIAHAGDSRCYVIDIKGNVKYRTIDHIESSSISLPYINKAFFTRHPEDAVPDVKTVELQPLDRIIEAVTVYAVSYAPLCICHSASAAFLDEGKPLILGTVVWICHDLSFLCDTKM